jgi:hypothetical protein
MEGLYNFGRVRSGSIGWNAKTGLQFDLTDSGARLEGFTKGFGMVGLSFSVKAG